MASDAAGNFVVVWESYGQDGSSYGVFGQRYASTGAPLGPEFRVNTYTTGYQHDPAVASDSSGNFVVVWTSDGQDGSGNGVFGQRYDSSGAPLGPEFRVNTYTTDAQTASVRGLGHRRQLRRRLGELVAGRLELRRLRPALRQLRRAARPRVPRQHLHDEQPEHPGRRLGRLRQLRRRLAQLSPGRLEPTASSASATPARRAARPRVPGQHLHDGDQSV